MSKELTTEEYYNKLWLENKDLIQENIDKLNTKRFALEMELIDKDKEIERLNNIINELEEDLKVGYFSYQSDDVDYISGYNDGATLTAEFFYNRLKELKGEDKE